MFLGEAIHNKFYDVASAATTDLSATDGDNVNITGTTTITSFGTARSGVHRLLRFSGSLTLTHSANLQCPGDVSISVSAGDYAWVVSRGAGVWEVVGFWPADAARQFITLSLFGGAHGGAGYGFSNQLIIEDNGPAGINFRTPDANSGEINWSSATDSRGATIGWSYDSQQLFIGTRSAGHSVVIASDNNGTALTLDSSQNATFGGYVDVPSADGYRVNNVQVVGSQQSAIADLNQTISDPPTQAEVQAISDKVDAVLAMLRTHGLIAT